MQIANKSLCLKKESRLLTREDFLYLKARSKRYVTPLLVLYFRNSRLNCQNTRVGFSISRKVGKAFVRNRLKRILKETFRHSEYKFSGFDGLFVVNPKVSKIFSTSESLEETLIKDFKKLLFQAANFGHT